MTRFRSRMSRSSRIWASRRSSWAISIQTCATARTVDMSDQELMERFDRFIMEQLRRECEEIRRQDDTHDEWRRLNEDR